VNAMERHRRALVDEVCDQRRDLAAEVARLRVRNQEMRELLMDCRDRLRGCTGITGLAKRIDELLATPRLVEPADGKAVSS